MGSPFYFMFAAGLLALAGTGCNGEAAAAPGKALPMATAQADGPGEHMGPGEHKGPGEHMDQDRPAAAGDVSKPTNGFDGMPAVGTKAKCPVLGTEFAVTKSTLSSVYDGKTFVFCCASCKPTFDANPEKFIHG